jgi:hypothetical protein
VSVGGGVRHQEQEFAERGDEDVDPAARPGTGEVCYGDPAGVVGDVPDLQVAADGRVFRAELWLRAVR